MVKKDKGRAIKHVRHGRRKETIEEATKGWVKSRQEENHKTILRSKIP